LIDAFKMLPSGGAAVEVFGWGDSEYAADLKRKCGGFNVQFNAPYRIDQMGEAFSKFDVLVVPTIVHENYSLGVREALAAGKPVIVSNLRSQMDFVRDGVDGFHFNVQDPKDLAEKMQKFIREPRLVESLGKNPLPIRDVADQATELVQIYQSLTESRRSRRSRPEPQTLVNELQNQVAALRQWEETLESDLDRERKKAHQLSDQLSQKNNELAGIRRSLGYRFVRFYASRIDRLRSIGRKREKDEQK